jgi:hypothetical protein
MLISVLLVCWFLFGSACGTLRSVCFRWGKSTLFGGRPSSLFVVGISVKLSVMIRSVICFYALFVTHSALNIGLCVSVLVVDFSGYLLYSIYQCTYFNCFPFLCFLIMSMLSVKFT